MSSPIQRRKQQRIIGAAAVAVVLVSLALIFHGPFLVVLGFVQRPFVIAGTWVQQRTDVIFHAVTYQERVTSLEEQRNALAVDTAEFERLRLENVQLQEQLNYIARNQVTAITSSVIARSASDQSSTFLIDRGESDGVRIGSPVIVGSGILLGKVTSTTRVTATVTESTDYTSATAVTLLNETRTIGIAEGMTGNLIRLQYIPHDEVVEMNNIVVTSGLEEEVPSGLLVGIVNDIQTDPSAPFQEAIVEPLVNSQLHNTVSVLVRDEAEDGV